MNQPVPTRKTTEQKRTEAIARQEAHDSLSIDKKIEKARARPGNSKRELSRLTREKMEQSND